MNLREIIDAFSAIELGISITEPREMRLSRVYKYLPPGNQVLETPCIMHQYRRISGARIVGARMSDFMIRVQLMLAPSDTQETDIWSEIAAAFDEALVQAFDEHVTLGEVPASSFQRITEEQGEYQPGIVDWNGKGYIGCQYEYRVSAHANVAFR